MRVIWIFKGLVIQMRIKLFQESLDMQLQQNITPLLKLLVCQCWTQQSTVYLFGYETHLTILLNCYISFSRIYRSEEAPRMWTKQRPNHRRETGLGKGRRRSQLWSPFAEKTTLECKGLFVSSFLQFFATLFWQTR